MTGDAESDRLIALIDAAGVAYWQTLGISVESVEVGHVLLRLPMSPALGTRRTDVMHGGAIASLIDATTGASTATLRRDDDESWTGQATLDLNVTFLAAATSDVVAEGRVLRSNRAFSFVSVDVLDVEGTLVGPVARPTRSSASADPPLNHGRRLATVDVGEVVFAGDLVHAEHAPALADRPRVGGKGGDRPAGVMR